MKLKRLLSVVCAVLCMACLCIAPVYADTDGTEMNVAEASKLEIQLGPEWVGVEFQLKTDVGMYPDVIPVGEDGVLRLEIGGSSTYILSCLNSSVAIPEVNEDGTAAEVPSEGDAVTEAPVEDAAPDVEQAPVEQPDAEAPDESAPDVEENTVAGIPVKHLVLFGGGLVLAVGGLIAIRFVSNRRKEGGNGYYDDDEYDDDED